MAVLFVDACPRTDSRTRRLAHAVLSAMDEIVICRKLSETDIPVIDEPIVYRRFTDGKKSDFSSNLYELARQFAEADTIVIAAPFWDLSFPALLKRYIEAVTVSGLTFRYSETGIPIGLCRAKKLYYITTSGGPILHPEFGYGYVKTLAAEMYGIPDCILFSAENLDIIGMDAEDILKKAIETAVVQVKKEKLR